MKRKRHGVRNNHGGGTRIGEATAHEFTKKGHAIVLVGRRVDKLEEVASAIDKSGRTVLPISADVRNPNDINRIVEMAAERFGRIDHLIKNAAIIKAARWTNSQSRISRVIWRLI